MNLRLYLVDASNIGKKFVIFSGFTYMNGNERVVWIENVNDERTRCCKRLYTYSINVEGEKECKLCRSVFCTRVREENILLVVCYVPDLVRVITSKRTQGKRSCFG